MTSRSVPLRIRITLAALGLAAVAGGLLSLRASRRAPVAADGAAGGAADGTTRAPVAALRLYTNPGTTTPQIPLWAAVRAGRLETVFSVQTELWKTTDHLQGVLLAGEGDAWIGRASCRERVFITV